MTGEHRRRVNMIKKLAAYFRTAAPEKWAGLPEKRGARPTRLGANLFVLGCAIDFRRDADSAWDAADYFLFNIVPSSQRERMWNWIVETHTPRRWDEKRAAYGLHRFPAGHKRVYRIARALVSLVDGDPRNLWRHAPKSVESIDYTESVLHAIQFGPELSHMLVGALRDHGVVSGPSHFKADVHVCRGMHALGLAPSEDVRTVREAGAALFDQDSWGVDVAFFRLGRLGLRTRSEIEAFAHDCLKKRKTPQKRQELAQRWRVSQNAIDEAVTALRGRTKEFGNWRLNVRTGKDAGTKRYGFTLTPHSGRLAREFVNDNMGLWIGVERQGQSINLWSNAWFSVNGRAGRSRTYRRKLHEGGLRFTALHEPGNWKEYDKRMASIPLAHAFSARLRRRIVDRVVRGARAAVQSTHGV